MDINQKVSIENIAALRKLKQILFLIAIYVRNFISTKQSIFSIFQNYKKEERKTFKLFKNFSNSL